MTRDTNTYIWQESRDEDQLCVGKKSFRPVKAEVEPFNTTYTHNGWLLSFTLHVDELFDLVGQEALEKVLREIKLKGWARVGFTLELV